MEDEIKAAKEGVTLVGELIKAAGDNPQVKAAGSNLGQAALTLSKTINTVLLPLAALNFAVDKAREYFSDKFPQEITERASTIPPESLVEPKASIAGPVLQGLAFTHEELDLKVMYLGLMTTAMDQRVADYAHPAYVEIIKQLDSREARYLKDIFGVKISAFPVAEIRRIVAGSQGWTIIYRHLMGITESSTNLPVEEPRFPASVDNWIRLGLIEVEYGTYLMGDEKYSWVESRPEYVRLNATHKTDQVTLSYQRGILRTTEFGANFAVAVGLRSADEKVM